MPSRNHGRVQTNLIVEFFQQQQFSIYSELTLTIGGVNYTPDISIYPRETADYRHDEVTRTELPLVAVEILSPSQSHQEVVEKAELYLRHGVKTCWIVSPPLRTVTLLLPGGREAYDARIELRSQARSKVQSRSALRNGMLIASAASGMDMPTK